MAKLELGVCGITLTIRHELPGRGAAGAEAGILAITYRHFPQVD